MVTEVEVAASRSVTPGHQRCVLDAWLQDARCPHNQEAQYQQQELPQTPQQLPAAWVWPPLGSSRQKQLEHPEGSKVHELFPIASRPHHVFVFSALSESYAEKLSDPGWLGQGWYWGGSDFEKLLCGNELGGLGESRAVARSVSALPIKLQDNGPIDNGKTQQPDPAESDAAEYAGLEEQDEHLVAKGQRQLFSSAAFTPV